MASKTILKDKIIQYFPQKLNKTLLKAYKYKIVTLYTVKLLQNNRCRTFNIFIWKKKKKNPPKYPV